MNFEFLVLIFFSLKLCQTIFVPKPTTSLRHLNPNDKSLLSRDFPAENPLAPSYSKNSFVSTTDDSDRKSGSSNKKIMNSLKNVGVGLSAVGALATAGMGLHQLLTQHGVTSTTTFNPLYRQSMMSPTPYYGTSYNTMRPPTNGSSIKPVVIVAGGAIFLVLSAFAFVMLGRRNKNP